MLSYLFGISRRWEFLFLCWTGIVVVYTLRVNMSVAAERMKDDLDWDEQKKGLVLSAFYWGYAIGQIPASRFAQYYGAKWLFGFSVLIPSVLTLFVPISCRQSFIGALLIRALIGLIESASFPAVFYFYPSWFPVKDKTLMVAMTMTGMYMGEIIGFSVSGVLIESGFYIGEFFIGDWPAVFYLFGFLGVIWFPLWAYFAYETPDVHPCISPEEILYIKKGVNVEPEDSNSPLLGQSDSQPDTKAPKEDVRSLSIDSNCDLLLPTKEELAKRTPFREFFIGRSSYKVYTVFFQAFIFGWIGFTLLSEMPSYLVQELHFSISTAGVLSVVPYAGLFISTMLFGSLFSRLQLHYGWSVRFIRQVAQYASMGGSALCLIICGYLNHSRWAAYFFIILSQLLFGASNCGLALAYLDLAPNYSSVLNAYGNTLAAIAGILGPIIVSVFLSSYPGSNGWRISFLLTGAIAATSLVTWSLFQSSELDPLLNSPAPEDNDDKLKRTQNAQNELSKA